MTTSITALMNTSPHFIAYALYRNAWQAGASEAELNKLASELLAGLPPEKPPPVIALLIGEDIKRLTGMALPAPLMTGLWIPRDTL